MKQYYLSIVLLFFISFLFGQDAASIINKTESNYATMKTYLDSGKAESVFYHSPNLPHSTTVLFKTAYSQNGVLNYEFYEPGKLNSLHIINRDINNKVQKWDGVSNLIKVDTSLSIPLASAAATSYTASVLITNLLMPDDKILSVFNVFKSLSDLKLASEIVNGNPCYKITGIKNQKQEQSNTIWVSEKDFLILKVEENYGDNNNRVKNTLQFFPYTLKTLDKDLFAFNPNHQIPITPGVSKKIPFTDTNKVVYDEKGNALRYYQYSKMLESGEYTIGTRGDPYLPDTKFYLEKTSSLMLRMRENQATNAVRSQRTDVVSGNILKENNTLDVAPLMKVLNTEYFSSKILLLVFWDPDCEACTDRFKEINNFTKDISPKDLIIVLITPANENKALAKLKEKPLLNARLARNIAESYHVIAYPTYIIADGSRTIKLSSVGLSPDKTSKVQSTLESLLKQ